MAAASILLLVWVVRPLPSFNKCIKFEKNDQPYQALHNNSSIFLRSLARGRLNGSCLFDVANENQSGIVALGTIALAIFTLTLWISTHKLYRAGERQIELAHSGLSRGNLFINFRRSNFTRWRIGQDPGFIIEVGITNFGSGPAILSSVIISNEISIEVPPLRIFKTIDMLTDNVVKPGGTKVVLYDNFVIIEGQRYKSASRMIQEEILEGRLVAYCGVLVEYTDIYMRSFVTEACFNFNVGLETVAAAGGQERNYQT